MNHKSHDARDTSINNFTLSPKDSSTRSSLAPSPQPTTSHHHLSMERDPLLLEPPTSSSPPLSPKQPSSSSDAASSSTAAVAGAGAGAAEVDEEDDVMRLPSRDRHIFGHCPIQDDFVLVVCDLCGRHVKLEAFEHHFR